MGANATHHKQDSFENVLSCAIDTETSVDLNLFTFLKHGAVAEKFFKLLLSWKQASVERERLQATNRLPLLGQEVGTINSIALLYFCSGLKFFVKLLLYTFTFVRYCAEVRAEGT